MTPVSKCDTILIAGGIGAIYRSGIDGLSTAIVIIGATIRIAIVIGAVAVKDTVRDISIIEY